MMQQDPSKPNWRHPAAVALDPKRQRSRDLIAGTDAIHANALAYLPKWPGEDHEKYQHRAKLAELFGAYARTLDAGEGLVFAEPPRLEDGAGQAFVDLADDLDGMGNALPVFARTVFHDSLADGVGGVLVDYPTVPDVGQVSLRQAAERGLRPYFVRVPASAVVNWRATRVGANEVLTLLVLADAFVAETGFGFTVTPGFRVYRRTDAVVTVERWRQRSGTTDVAAEFDRVQEPTPIVGPREIPFAPCYGGRMRETLVASPPLDQLAWLNIGHYRVSADHRTLMSVAHAPTVCVEKWGDADNPPKINIGPFSLITLLGEATAKFLQADADALQASERTMARQEQQMAALGMAFLARDRARDETATGRRLDAAADFATLGTAADGLKDCLERALQFAADFLSIPREQAPAVAVSTTYDESRLDAPTILALSALAEKAQISVRTLLQELQRGRVLSEGVDLDDEEAAAMAAQAIEQERQAEAAEQAAARLSAAGSGV
ncbi:MAG: DUF4055 domain-containing protein [Gemmatimonadetes bacterium]|jgi:hypothetical protein|nr:DUF4055 domain-containing protein [Gemmatimonadota bacterium]